MSTPKAHKPSSFGIRSALPSDLPCLRNFVKDSFEELIQEHGEAIRGHITSAVQSILEKDYSSEERLLEIFSKREKLGGSVMFVAVDEKNQPIGSCGGLQKNYFELELIRLYVLPEYRGSGVARALGEKLIRYAEEFKYERIVLTCGSKSGQRFYEKLNFFRVMNWKGRAIYYSKILDNVPRRKFDKVAIIGGVHGNELIGVHLVESWKDPKNFAQEFQDISTFHILPIVANVEACKKCVRYIDRDLNRCFALSELCEDSVPETLRNAQETKRALELNEILGPKSELSSSFAIWKHQNPDLVDYLIDLHCTTSNMGICLITLAGDQFSIRLAYELMNFCKLSSSTNIPFNLLVDSTLKRSVYNNIDSVTPSGICLEVGALAHGKSFHE